MEILQTKEKEPSSRMILSVLVEAEGLDLRCGGGQVAALTPHRGVIHFRSRSSPFSAKAKNPPLWDGFFALVEAEGLEPTTSAM